MMNKEQHSALKMPFEHVLIKPGKGEFKYVPVNDIIDRMNDVFEGRWSTEVIAKEVFEDQILLQVRVSVRSAADNILYYHDGFASQPVQRFTYGDNKGKPVDLGNSYTAALSKALKQACKKWGVALNIDEEVEVETVIPTTTFSMVAPVKSTLVNESTMSIPIPTSMPTSQTKAPVIPSPVFKEEEVEEERPKMSAPVTPKLPGMSAPVGSLVPNMPTMPSQPMMPKTPIRTAVTNTPTQNPGFMGSVGAVRDGKISQVQKAALNGVLSLKTSNKTPEEVETFYKQMAQAAFEEKGITKTYIPAIDELDYDDAVIVVKYGNELLRGNR